MKSAAPFDWSTLPEGASAEDDMSVFEREAWAAGRRRIAGIDEAGRGPLAGPIAAAAVILSEPVPGVNDSKVLSERQREVLFERLVSGSHAIGVETIEASVIDAEGIQSANYAAMARAMGQLDPPPDFLLVDGFAIQGCAVPQHAIVKGDRLSQSIAAASIIAKVTRDRIMKQLDVQYPEYGFAKHKGYGTRAHIEALQKFGPCDAHRKSFAPIRTSVETGRLFQQKDLTA